jgi:hypothetical protein
VGVFTNSAVIAESWLCNHCVFRGRYVIVRTESLSTSWRPLTPSAVVYKPNDQSTIKGSRTCTVLQEEEPSVFCGCTQACTVSTAVAMLTVPCHPPSTDADSWDRDKAAMGTVSRCHDHHEQARFCGIMFSWTLDAYRGYVRKKNSFLFSYYLLLLLHFLSRFLVYPLIVKVT